MAKKKLDPKSVREAAQEIEDILAPEDDEGNPIKMAKGSVQEMQDKIIAAAEVLTPDDELSENLQKVLDFLNVGISADEDGTEDTEEIEDEDQEDEDEEIVEEENDTPEPEEEEEDLLTELEGTKKLNELKDLVSIHDEFKSLRKGIDSYKGLAGPRDLKAKMMKLLGVDTEKRKADKKTATKKKTTSGPSNKEVIYLLWVKNKKITPDEGFKAVKEAVKLNTVKAWLNEWSKGKNLPACATKE